MADQPAETKLAVDAALSQIEHFEKAKTETPPTPTKEALQDAQLSVCPRCQFKISSNNVPEPAEEDIREYIRRLMAGELFKKTYDLFNGSLKITLSMISMTQSDLLSQALQSIPDEDYMVRTTRALRIKQLFYLKQYKDVKYDVPDTGDLDKLEDLYIARFGELPEDVCCLLVRVMTLFFALTEALPHKGLDENFWKGAGLS